MSTEIFVKSINAYLPEQVLTIDEAISTGLYSAERAAVDGFTALRIEENLSSAEMAVKAALPGLSSTDPDAVNSLYLCSIHRHGHKILWPPASYVQHQLGLGRQTRALGISQGCNGGFVACSLATDLIQHGLTGDHLVLGADRFSGSGFDRINSDLGTLYGDAAFALRLGSGSGAFRLLYMGLESEPELEAMYRDTQPAPEGIVDHDIKSAKRNYLEQHGRDHFNRLFISALQRLRASILAQVNLVQFPARYIVFPNVGAGLSAKLYAEEFADLASENLWGFGRSIGHLGTSDQFLGLWHIDRCKPLRPGERVLLLGAGNGLGLG
ncbi:ketoacyl-ACP synthase III family protein, partial [Marinobacter alexandrii]|uniref:ketoacyl-ACP synthase III family protein n=1 Tax=Marinobacter alexandrii TaxID=2570351 RepID=UPI0032972539